MFPFSFFPYNDAMNTTCFLTVVTVTVIDFYDADSFVNFILTFTEFC